MAIARFYNKSVEVFYKSYTQDAVGGRVETLNSRGTADCRVEEVTGQEKTYLGIDRSVWTLRIFCSPTGFYVHQGDMVTTTYNNETVTLEVQIPDRLFQVSAFHHYELIVMDHQNQNGHNS